MVLEDIFIFLTIEQTQKEMENSSVNFKFHSTYYRKNVIKLSFSIAFFGQNLIIEAGRTGVLVTAS